MKIFTGGVLILWSGLFLGHLLTKQNLLDIAENNTVTIVMGLILLILFLLYFLASVLQRKLMKSEGKYVLELLREAKNDNLVQLLVLDELRKNKTITEDQYRDNFRKLMASEPERPIAPGPDTTV